MVSVRVEVWGSRWELWSRGLGAPARRGRASGCCSVLAGGSQKLGFLPTSIDPATEVGKPPPSILFPHIKQSYSFLLGDCQVFLDRCDESPHLCDERPRRKEQQTFKNNRVTVNSAGNPGYGCSLKLDD